MKKKEKELPPMRTSMKEWDRVQVIDYVCEELSNSSLGVKNILASAPHDMPTRKTVMLWLVEDESLCDTYTRAKDSQADYMAEEILDIADDSSNDYMTRKRGDDEIEVLDSEHVQRSKLRIESRKWLMSKLKPKKYGDRVNQVHEGTIGLSGILSELDGTTTGLPTSE